MLDTYEQNSRKKLIATVVTVLVIAGAVVLADIAKTSGTSQTTSDSSDSATDSTTTSQTSATASADSSSGYKDGAYSATADYFVPSSTETIKVSLTLSDGTVTDVSVVNSARDHDSAEYQADFTDSYKSQVVGQKISGLQIDSVAGASDTTEGFNEALNQIEAEAQA